MAAPSIGTMVDNKDEKALDAMAEAWAREEAILAERNTNAPLVPHEDSKYHLEGHLGDSIFHDWRLSFLACSIDNDFYASGCFHLVFGQLPNIRKIRITRSNGSYRDPRVHLAFLAPSASGKGEGLKYLERMCMLLNLKLQTVDRVTDAGLIGTHRRDEEGNLIYTPGWLHPDNGINIFAAKEATNIIKDTAKNNGDAQEIMNTLQTLMNDMDSTDGRISKKLAEGDPIEFNPTASFYLTSFMLPYMDNILLERGLFQRMYLSIKETSIKDRLEVSRKLREQEDNGTNYLHLEREIAERLLYIDSCYANTQEMHLSPGALEVFMQQEERFVEKTLVLHPTVQDMLMPFLGRFESLQTKIAMHFACLRLHSRIERLDADAAVFFTNELLQTLAIFLELRATPSKKDLELTDKIHQRTSDTLEDIITKNPVRYAKSMGYVERELIIRTISKRFKVSEAAANTYLLKLLAWGAGEKRTHAGIQYFRMKPDQ